MEWINSVLRDVAELPDRNSPEDWPEAMLVTGAELRQIIITHAPAEPVNARLTDNDVVDLFQAWNTTYGTSHADLIRAVETAVLERNGLNPQAKGDCNG